jgi:hypothetical protein
VRVRRRDPSMPWAPARSHGFHHRQCQAGSNASQFGRTRELRQEKPDTILNRPKSLACSARKWKNRRLFRVEEGRRLAPEGYALPSDRSRV